MEDRIQLLLTNPRKAMTQPWFAEPAVFDAFLVRCKAIVNADPRAGKEHALFIRRHAPTNCYRVQGLGLWAQIHRATEETTVAEKAIEDGFLLGGDCDSCVADLHRRRAVLRRSRRDFSAALEDADESITRYSILGHSGHDIDKNGLASSYYIRAGIHLYAETFQASIQDMHTALSLIDPKLSPTLYRLVVANLAVALYNSGRRSDLLEAARYLKKARRLFSGVSKRSQEWAKLAWLTAQVRYKLGKGRPYELRNMMEHARADFLTLGFPLEAVAIGSDLMKMKLAKNRWGQGTARDLCRDMVADLLELPKLSAEVVAALHQVDASVEEYGWHAKDKIKTSVDQLREACGPNMMACLLTWDAA